jgi:hypothetical protein
MVQYDDYVRVMAVLTILCYIATNNLKYACIVGVLALINYIFFLKVYACARAEDDDLRHFLADMRVIAHRGLAADAPENTPGAIRLVSEACLANNAPLSQAASRGAHAVEVDISMTSDGVAVLMHDDTLDRTTDGRGLVNAHTYAQLKQLNAAAKWGDG